MERCEEFSFFSCLAWMGMLELMLQVHVEVASVVLRIQSGRE